MCLRTCCFVRVECEFVIELAWSCQVFLASGHLCCVALPNQLIWFNLVCTAKLIMLHSLTLQSLSRLAISGFGCHWF